MTTFDEKALEAAYKAFEDAEQLPFGALPTINWSNNDRTKQKIKIAIRTYLSHLPASPAAGELRERLRKMFEDERSSLNDYIENHCQGDSSSKIHARITSLGRLYQLANDERAIMPIIESCRPSSPAGGVPEAILRENFEKSKDRNLDGIGMLTASPSPDGGSPVSSPVPGDVVEGSPEDVLDTAMRALERAKEKTNALACGFWAPDQNELSSAMAGEASHIFDYIEEAQANVARAAGLSPSDPDKIFNEAIEAVFNFFDPPDTTTKIGDREYKVTHDPYCKLVGIWAAIKERCFDNLEVDELQKLANEILEIQRKIRSLKRPTQPDKG